MSEKTQTKDKESGKRPKRKDGLTLAPLSFEEALKDLLETEPPTNKQTAKKKTEGKSN